LETLAALAAALEFPNWMQARFQDRRLVATLRQKCVDGMELLLSALLNTVLRNLHPRPLDRVDYVRV
jgi:hypothetical protein